MQLMGQKLSFSVSEQFGVNMALSPQIQLKQGQSLAMTPQLQQAIKLLQLSNIELAAYVEEQIESNPLLEHGTGTENRRGEEVTDGSSESETQGLEELNLSAPNAQAADAIDAPERALDADASVADLVPSAPTVGGEIDWSKAGSGGSFSSSGDYDAAANTAYELSLREYLQEQLSMTTLSDGDRLVARYLIDHVDDNGYIRVQMSELSERLGISHARVLSVLTQLQTFEPTGVLARDLGECLSLQLREQGNLDTSMIILLENLPLLANRDFKTLCTLCDQSRQELAANVSLMQTLSPKPGLAFGGDQAAIVEPDVFIREQPNGGWSIELNSETLPRVLVNSRYYAEICNSTEDKTVQTYMSECQQNASWLVKSLNQRARTILKVVTEIVKQQDGFFAYGVDHLRPLNLRTIAEAIEMHESTVSRVTSNKFMSTPRGMFELKYFFTSAISSTDGQGAVSAEAVRHKIKILISEETTPKSVLSDDKIVELLRAQDIEIARRTVAKYREALGIQSSVQRRRILRDKAF